MNKIISIEPAIDPNARPTFLLDWELTLKCNLDCSYCPTSEDNPISLACHDNSTEHPTLEECIKTIDSMYEYVDLYMKQKPRWNRLVILNIYGGESLFHPNIIEILQQVRIKHQKYAESWPLTVTCTTNGVVGKKLITRAAEFIDEFTVSYHSESLIKQKQQVRDNLLYLKNSKKRVKCVVLMHTKQEKWPELLDHIEFCKTHSIRYLPRQLDHHPLKKDSSIYSQQQIIWFQGLWAKNSLSKSREHQKQLLKGKIDPDNDQIKISEVGRACCGGRLICTNSDLSQPIFYVPDNNFHGWKCSVNWYFLYIKQYTKEIYSNKDCRMNLNSETGPIGYVDKFDKLINDTKHMLDSNNMPIITCKKTRCMCGLCAPKAETEKDLLSILEKHVTDTKVFLTDIAD